MQNRETPKRNRACSYGAARLLVGGAMAGCSLAPPLAAYSATYSFVDLNPNGFDSSYAFGVSGGQQVGYGSGPASGGQTHALLWSDSAATAVDLNPGGFVASYATGVSAGEQVGYGWGTAGGGPPALFC